MSVFTGSLDYCCRSIVPPCMVCTLQRRLSLSWHSPWKEAWWQRTKVLLPPNSWHGSEWLPRHDGTQTLGVKPSWKSLEPVKELVKLQPSKSPKTPEMQTEAKAETHRQVCVNDEWRKWRKEGWMDGCQKKKNRWWEMQRSPAGPFCSILLLNVWLTSLVVALHGNSFLPRPILGDLTCSCWHQRHDSSFFVLPPTELEVILNTPLPPSCEYHRPSLSPLH